MMKTKLFMCLLMAGLVFSANTAMANKVSCLSQLDGKKCDDTEFVDTGGQYASLSMYCNPRSKFGTMAVIRGRHDLPMRQSDKNGTWLMSEALKCKKGKSNYLETNILKYAERHKIVYKTNFFNVRQYGNTCDEQEKGCYGSAIGATWGNF